MPMSIDEILKKIAGRRVLVVGDMMLDRYVRGTAERISPEAPVPVLKVREETSSPGGAGNVALNLLALGARVEIAGVVGNDPEGKALVSELKSSGAGTSSIVTDPRKADYDQNEARLRHLADSPHGQGNVFSRPEEHRESPRSLP